MTDEPTPKAKKLDPSFVPKTSFSPQTAIRMEHQTTIGVESLPIGPYCLGSVGLENAISRQFRGGKKAPQTTQEDADVMRGLCIYPYRERGKGKPRKPGKW